MIKALHNFFNNNKQDIYLLMRRYVALDKTFLLRSDLWDEYQNFLAQIDKPELNKSSQLGKMISQSEEAIIQGPLIYFTLRPRIGRYHYLAYHLENLHLSEISVNEYLLFKEAQVHQSTEEKWVLEFDLTPFERGFPKLKESRSIGHGVEFLNKRLSSQLFADIEKGGQLILDFLRVHQYRGEQLMLSHQLIQNTQELRQAIHEAEDILNQHQDDVTWDTVRSSLEALGFLPGWGRTVPRIKDTLRLLSDLLEAPGPDHLERFLSRIPMIFNVIALSPHGFFGQSNVLGLPDTGGQVVYILNQVHALEKEMHKRIWEQGLDIKPKILVVTRLIPEAPQGTTCNQRLEQIIGTENSYILRVPFRTEGGEIIPQWISRFDIWPYLERFAKEAEKEILVELGGRPDLIVGNYSDGNLVAMLLSQSLHVTQCNIAHALEKAKYLFSAVYWKENDSQYHFASQFTADLIAMNWADFIITSTYQEIAGREESVGQYESYTSFTMPDLYRVVNGIDVFDPKFNVVSPGANSEVYFPYYENEKRFLGLADELKDLIYGQTPRDDARGILKDTTKPIIFTMARLDRIKNITGLVELYGESPELQELCNLVVIAGYVNPEQSRDREEQAQIAIMHDLISKYALDDKVRWLGVQLEKNLSGELYRFIADNNGIFAQPAQFEAFGLTVIEAMISGLPTFATRYGGPLEIIEHGVSGFHIDPNHGDVTAKIFIDFFKQCSKDPNHWKAVSDGGIERVLQKYTWELYAERMMTLSRIYGFWKYVTNLERAETHRYLEMFYGLQFRQLANDIQS